MFDSAITGYKIARAATPEKLEDSVTELLKENFVPFGHLIVVDSPLHRYYQVMIKTAPQKTFLDLVRDGV